MARRVDENRILRDALAGSSDAMQSLLRLCSPTLRAYIDRRTGPKLRRFMSVSDLEQDILLSAIDAMQHLPPDASFADFRRLLNTHATWRIHNAAKKGLKFAGESVPGVGAVPRVQSTDGTSGPVTRADELEWLWRHVDAMEPDLAEVIRLRYQQRSFAEIALELDITESAARKRFLRAAENLATARGRRPGETPPARGDERP